MLPAGNRNAGENVGFPDTCNTPSGTTDVPVPYVNTADNTQATNFATTVKLEGGNAVHLGTTIPQTSGDEAGVDHPTIKGKGAYTTGNPTIFIEQQMAISLACPTTGNAGNNAIGLVAVPSTATVFFSDAGAPVGEARPLAARDLEALAAAVAPSASAIETELDGGQLVVRLRRFTEDAPSRIVAAFERARANDLAIDLRGNGGGDLGAAERLLDELLPAGAPLFAVDRGDGDVETRTSRGGALTAVPLVLTVDAGTASAAEAFAATLIAHGRARVDGERTHGKSSVQHVVGAADGHRVYATVARVLVPTAGGGMTPLEPIDPPALAALRA